MSLKDKFMEIASRHDPRPPNALARIMADPEFKRYFPQAVAGQEPDSINFDGFTNGWNDVPMVDYPTDVPSDAGTTTVSACFACGSRHIVWRDSHWCCCHCGSARVPERE